MQTEISKENEVGEGLLLEDYNFANDISTRTCQNPSVMLSCNLAR